MARLFCVVFCVIAFFGFSGCLESPRGLGNGIVVEEVAPRSTLAAAGLAPGDVVLAWEREAEHGEIVSVFDWQWLKIEQAPRGTVKLSVRREGEEKAFEVPLGEWNAEIRPVLPASMAEVFSQGLGHLEAKETAAAVSTWTEITEAAVEQDDAALSCWILWRIGEAWADTRKWEKAGTAFSSALEHASTPAARATLWDALGDSQRWLGQFEEADLSIDEALGIRRQTWGEESLSFAQSLVSFGSLAGSRSQGDLAEEYHRRALEIRRKLAPGSVDMAISLFHLARVAKKTGDLAKAESYYQKVYDIYKRLVPESLRMARLWNNLGALSRDRSELEAARERYQRALDMFIKIGEPLKAAAAWNNLGVVAELQGNWNEAEKLYREALKIYYELDPGGPTYAAAVNNLASKAEEHGDWQRAREHYERAAEIFAETAPDSLDLAIALQNLGNTVLELGEPEAAKHHLERALEIEEKVAPGSLYVADTLESLGILARRTGRTEEAAELFRRAIEALDSQVGKLGSTFDTQAGFRALYGHFWRNAVEALLELERPTEAFAVVEASRARSFLEMLASRDLADDLAATLDWPGTRAILDPGTVMLSYSAGEEKTDLFVATGKDLRTERIGIGEEDLQLAIDDLRGWIERATPGAAGRHHESLAKSSRKLYSRLLAPVADRLEDAERLLIVPDGPLHLLPWGALTRESGEFLIEWKPIHTVLSATVYARLREGRRDAGDFELAAFGDSVDSRPLPASRREVEEIAALFSGADSYLGTAATKEAVRNLDRGTRYVHFAVHGTFDERSPLDSALAFAAPETSGQSRDGGLLRAWEIIESVRLDADLVVLSACSSALGKELGGEGLIGLTRAFHYAGARSVVASLWNVSDVTTAELMVRFYRHLREGKPKDEALRAAQLELIRAPIEVAGEKGERDASSPYYWAAFQLLGDWR